MKLYMVTTYAPLFPNCGKLKAKVRVFTGVTSAKSHFGKEKKRCEQFEEFYIVIEELTLKELLKEELRAAFEAEDIVELIGTREVVLSLEKERA